MNKEQDPDKEGNIQRIRLTVTGVVQGVGFRPFVYGMALEHQLFGFVGNDSGGVFIELEGPAAAISSFREKLIASPPPLAHIESVTSEDLAIRGDSEFIIVHSQNQAAKNTLISPDICICDDCLAELLDRDNRRFHYPFINCTNCGPRFTIIKDIPYDRPLTTMAEFPMCADCLAEYENPLDRRFHAQPNACSVCGPYVWLEISRSERETTAREQQAIDGTRRLLAEGKTVAVKGLGGFHLACDAANDKAIELLRERKGRVDKPFAVMALDITAVRTFAYLSPAEEQLLGSKERPILLLRKKPDHHLSNLIAPGNHYIGVMMPYTPLHYLLLQPVEEQNQPFVLVMTSANFSSEPIVKGNEEARHHLANLTDAFLFHNRDIHTRCDDSVLRLLPMVPEPVQGVDVVAEPDFGKPSLPIHTLAEPVEAPLATRHSPLNFLPIRRSRGYAPFPVKLPFPVPPILAVGGELKATFCLANENYAYMSQHIGDMENLETLQAFETAVNHYQHIFRITPQIIACDRHPRYLSTRWVEEQAGELPVIKTQHHHAHITAVMAENGLDGSRPVIGFSFDGTGYGPDGAIWGGEVLIATYRDYERVWHISYMPLVGGDAAVKRPYRLALAYLHAADIPWDERLPCVAACPVEEQGIIKRQLETDLNVVPTSSMGRLFDAVASLAGVRQTITYEAQAAIELEALAAESEQGAYSFALSADEFNPAPLLQAVTADVIAGIPTQIISARFHNAVANLVLQISQDLRRSSGINQVALSGGVFQNITLLQRTLALLTKDGFEPIIHHLVPPNDGGLALGQAIIAAATI